MLIKKLLLLVSILLISACQATRIVQPYAWPSTARVTAAQFKHLTLSQTGMQDSERLHVYIEGDGVPFRNRFQVAKDPSPHNPLMLTLMQQDKTASLYLGRPCYFMHSNSMMEDNLCDFHLWTDARYSDAVVTSMVDALRQYTRNHQYHGITLIGHSGGGTIATLMAARMPEVDQLVTLAGNLDIQAWTSLHHYSSLSKSLNPADKIDRAQPKKQIHFMGEKDDNIPPALAKDFLAKIGQQGEILKDADHNCCWQLHWQELLVKIDKQMQIKNQSIH